MCTLESHRDKKTREKKPYKKGERVKKKIYIYIYMYSQY